MQTANEIQAALSNIKYYSQQIRVLAKKQFDIDCEQGDRIGMSSLPGSARFTSLGAIQSSCGWLDVYCNNIESNLKTAVGQDKLLHSPEEEASDD